MKNKMKTILKISVCLAFAVILPVSMGSCFSKKNRDSQKLIIAIIDEKNIDEVRRLLEQGVDPNVPDIPESKFYDFLEHLEWTPRAYPLSEACKYNVGYEMVKLLIDYGTTADFSDKNVTSPLYCAVSNDYCYPDTLRVVELLVENGADVNRKEHGVYPVETAARMQPKKYNPGIKSNSDFEDGYDEETAKEITEVVKLLLERMGDYDINSGSYTFTLLMRAATRGNIDLAEYLLSIGADTTIETSEGHKTAYDLAIDNGHVELAELLKP